MYVYLLTLYFYCLSVCMNECLKKYFRLKTTTDRPSHRQRAQISNYIRPANTHTHTHTHTRIWLIRPAEECCLAIALPSRATDDGQHRRPPLRREIQCPTHKTRFECRRERPASTTRYQQNKTDHYVVSESIIISRARTKRNTYTQVPSTKFSRQKERERERERASRQNAISCDVCTYIPGDTVTGLRTDDIPVSQSHFDPECTLFAAT